MMMAMVVMMILMMTATNLLFTAKDMHLFFRYAVTHPQTILRMCVPNVT